MRDIEQSRPRHYPECVPGDVVYADLEWRHNKQARAEVTRFNERQHQVRWSAWRKQADSVMHDWMLAQTERVAEIAKEIDLDRQRQMLDDEENKRRAYLVADAAENAKWVAQFSDAQHRANKTEIRKLTKDIKRDTASIDNHKRAKLKRRFRGNADRVTLDQLIR